MGNHELKLLSGYSQAPAFALHPVSVAHEQVPRRARVGAFKGEPRLLTGECKRHEFL